jgi:diacylglycerol kinase family enzyme
MISVQPPQPVDACRRTIIVAVNPVAGSTETAASAAQLESRLVSLGYDVQVRSDLGEILALADDCREGLRCVVAAGGDGTVGLLANRLPESTTLAILPQGTENLMAKYLQVPFQPDRVAAMIHDGWMVRLDAGRANGQLFLVMASCGFDAEVVRQVHRSRRGHIRHWAYAKPIVEAIRTYRYPTLTVRCDNGNEVVRVKWAFVFNAPRYAMGLPIAQDADPADGLLDLCGFRGGNLLNGLMYLAGVVTRTHRRWRDTLLARAGRITVESDEPVPFQLDGDPGGFLPLEIEVVPRRLRIIAPESWVRGHCKDWPAKAERCQPTGQLTP